MVLPAGHLDRSRLFGVGGTYDEEGQENHERAHAVKMTQPRPMSRGAV